MNHPTPAAGSDPVLLLLAACWLALEAAALLIVALIALAMALSGWQPPEASRHRPELPAPAPVASRPPAPVVAAEASMQAFTVADLRRLARAAGLPAALARGGRRADLLAALAPV